jgi:hypothetical protein
MPTFFESASNSLSLTQSAVKTHRNNQSAESDFQLVQFVLINFKLESVSSVLTLTDLADNDGIYNESVADTLTLTQTVSFTSSKSISTNNALSLSHAVGSNIKPAIATNALGLTQSVDVRGPIAVSASNNITDPLEADFTGVDLTDPDAVAAYYATIGLRHSVSVQTVLNLSITDYLSFSQQGVKCLEATASNHIHLLGLAAQVLWEEPVSVIQLTQSVIVHSVEPADTVLQLNHTVDSSGVIARALTDGLTLNSVATFFRFGDLCQYDPGVGDCGTGPSMTDPVLTRRSTILLTYPYVNPTYIVEVRNPIFDDNRQLEFRKINRKTRGGTLKIFRDSIWPSSERLIYTFDNLKEAKKKEILEFFEVTIGKEIGLLDFQSRQWRGIVITPTSQFGNEDRPGNSMTMEFEGTVDPGGLNADINANATIGPQLTDIPPGFQATVTGGNAALVADLIRD